MYKRNQLIELIVGANEAIPQIYRTNIHLLVSDKERENAQSACIFQLLAVVV